MGDDGVLELQVAAERQFVGVVGADELVEDVVDGVLQPGGGAGLALRHRAVAVQEGLLGAGLAEDRVELRPLRGELGEPGVVGAGGGGGQGVDLGAPQGDLPVAGGRVVEEGALPLVEGGGEQLAPGRAEGALGECFEDDGELPAERRRVLGEQVVAQPAVRGLLAALPSAAPG